MRRLIILLLLMITHNIARADTFGYTGAGGDSYATYDSFMRISSFTLTSAGTVSKLTARIWTNTNNEGDTNIKGLIFNDNEGVPATIVGVTAAVNCAAGSVTAFDLPFSQGVFLQPGVYWLGVINGGGGGMNIDIKLSVGKVIGSFNNYTAPTDFGSQTTSANRQVCIYATYTRSESVMQVHPPYVYLE